MRGLETLARRSLQELDLDMPCELPDVAHESFPRLVFARVVILVERPKQVPATARRREATAAAERRTHRATVVLTMVMLELSIGGSYRRYRLRAMRSVASLL